MARITSIGTEGDFPRVAVLPDISVKRIAERVAEEELRQSTRAEENIQGGTWWGCWRPGVVKDSDPKILWMVGSTVWVVESGIEIHQSVFEAKFIKKHAFLGTLHT